MKIGYGRVAALAATCGVVAIAPVQAQGPKPAKTVKPAAAQAAAGGPMNEVVGTVGGVKFTFGQVVAKAQKENASQFNQTVAQLIGLDAAKALFGPTPKSSYAVTKSQVLVLLREKKPPVLADTLKTMLEFEAVDSEVKKKGIVVTDAQVDTRIDQFLKMLRTRGSIPPGVTDAQFLEQNHVTRASLRKNFLVQAKLFTLIQQDFIEKKLGHKLTPDDFFKARHILVQIPMPVPGQTPADAKKVTFEQAVKDDSDDPGSKGMGGELGIQMGMAFDPGFAAALYQLKPGEISKPVRSKFGYHIIQVEQRGIAIPEADRQQYLDSMESGQMQLFLRDLLATTYKSTNKLVADQPQMMIPGQ